MTVPSNSIRSSFGNDDSLIVAAVVRQGKGAPKRPFDDRRLGRAQIDGRHPAALALFELVAQLLALLQRIHAGPLDRGNMNEDVIAPSRRLDKSVTLLGIEPFDRAGRHSQ